MAGKTPNPAQSDPPWLAKSSPWPSNKHLPAPINHSQQLQTAPTSCPWLRWLHLQADQKTSFVVFIAVRPEICGDAGEGQGISCTFVF